MLSLFVDALKLSELALALSFSGSDVDELLTDDRVSKHVDSSWEGHVSVQFLGELLAAFQVVT